MNDIEIFYGGRSVLMDLSKTKAVVVDDDVFKGADIRRALEFSGIRNVMIVRNQENCGIKYIMVRIR